MGQQGSELKIYLINPKFLVTFLGQEHGCQTAGTRYAGPPLSLLTVAGLTPPAFELAFCDENTHAIRWDTDAEVVALTGQHMQRQRLLEIANRFRALGKRIVIGGPSVTAMPEWYRPSADVLIRGEAEYIWPRFLNDLAAGKPQADYHETGQVDLRDSPIPRYELIKMRHYAYVGMQTTRGCPFTCEFCDIIVLYGRKVRSKSVDQVLAEVERLLSLGARRILVVDDNFIGNRRHAYDVLEAIRKLVRGLRTPPVFLCQATINIAKDPALLRLMHETGIRSMFVGIETPRIASLTETLKFQNTHTDLLRDIETVQSHGIVISAGSIVGFDHDDLGIFDEQVDFFSKAKVTLITAGQLTAEPGTPLHERMRQAGRLRDIRWYDRELYAESNIVPRLMTTEQLNAGYVAMAGRLYEPAAFADRLLGELERLDRAQTTCRAVYLSRPLVWLGIGWILLWYLADRDRRALLRLFWLVVPRLAVRHGRLAADFALSRLVGYRHMYRVVQAWACVQRTRLLQPAAGREEPVVHSEALPTPVPVGGQLVNARV